MRHFAVFWGNDTVKPYACPIQIKEGNDIESYTDDLFDIHEVINEAGAVCLLFKLLTGKGGLNQ